MGENIVVFKKEDVIELKIIEWGYGYLNVHDELDVHCFVNH